MTVYIVRWYDWDCESGKTIGVYLTFTDVVAALFEDYAGRFDPEIIAEPVKWCDPDRWIKYIDIPIDEYYYGKVITVECTEVQYAKM